jgi:hypothetical protein
MWTYEQATGTLLDGDGNVIAHGYSGAGDGKNDPSKQDEREIGPVPQGTYTIGAPEFVNTHGPHGPFVLPLAPDPGDEMFGRSGFLMHGDSVEHPGAASKGCIIMPRNVRENVWNSGDHRLQVVSGQSADAASSGN